MVQNHLVNRGGGVNRNTPPGVLRRKVFMKLWGGRAPFAKGEKGSSHIRRWDRQKRGIRGTNESQKGGDAGEKRLGNVGANGRI